MAEQCLSSSTDIPSIVHREKDLNSLDHRSLSNRCNVLSITPTPSIITTASSSIASSSASLTIYCIETGSIAQSIRRRQSLTNTTTSPNNIEMTTTTTTTSIDEGRLVNDNDKPQVLLTNAEKAVTRNDSDNDSSDDNETLIDESTYQKPFSIPPNYVISPCPICFEQAVLQVSPCCYFLCCNNCWRAHISATINDGRIKIPCVSNECNKYLTRESIVNFIRYDQPLHDRYLKLYLNANQNPRAKTCPRCCHLYSLDSIQSPLLLEKSQKKLLKINSKKIPKQVQCSECSFVWCFRCSAPWHENLTCKQFIKGDRLLSKWVNQKNDEQWNARKCPKCSSLIQRAGGCPHMTCQSCSCEFCYLCGRRYIPIPVIGQHSNKLSMFGCPYNFYPERPWLRRTIRGMIATGVVVASPVIVVGAITAAVTVLPPIGVYRLIKQIRSRRRRQTQTEFPVVADPFFLEAQLNAEIPRRVGIPLDFPRHPVADELMRELRSRFAGLSFTQTMTEEDDDLEDDDDDDNHHLEINFPLSIYAEMDVEHLFSDNDDDLNSVPLDFRTCPTTPAVPIRKGCSQSLVDLTNNCSTTNNRHHSIATEHQ